MTKNLTYIGGYPVVKAAGYKFVRGESVEVPAEIADTIIAAQSDENPASATEPLFTVEDAE